LHRAIELTAKSGRSYLSRDRSCSQCRVSINWEQVNQKRHFGPSVLCLVINNTHAANFLLSNLVATKDWTNTLTRSEALHGSYLRILLRFTVLKPCRNLPPGRLYARVALLNSSTHFPPSFGLFALCPNPSVSSAVGELNYLMTGLTKITLLFSLKLLLKFIMHKE